jgi:Flp pilus assembly protein TadD
VAPRLALAGVLLTLLAPVRAADRQGDPYADYGRARDLFSRGEYLDALRAYQRASRAEDRGLAAEAKKGTVRSALRIAEFDLARREADALLSGAGDDPDALALHGDALWASGLFEQADGSYGRALALDEGSARARFGIARSLAMRSRLDEALTQARTALGAAPEDADIHALSGIIYERMLRYDAAAAAYGEYADRLPATERTAVLTARARAQFLRSFGQRPPLATAEAAFHTMPFKLVRNKVVVPGRVNGASVEWVVDTGAERTGVSEQMAYAARVPAITTTLTAGVGRESLRRVRLARADRLEIGSLRISNVPISIRNPAFEGAPRWQAETLSPLALGLSVVIDYTKRQVTFAHQLPEPDAGGEAAVRLPMRLHRLPFVRGMLNTTHPVYFVVDTGGEVISISADTANVLGMQPARRIPLRVVGLSGPDEQAFLLPGVDVSFAALEYPNTGVAVLNLRAPSVLLGFQVGGIVGHKVLGSYRVSIDLQKSELRLESPRQ